MDGSSVGQKTQKTVLIGQNGLKQKIPKTVLKDKNSLRQKIQKETGNHTNLVNRKNKTSYEAYAYRNSMTLKEFLDYFEKQDMTVMDFMDTKEFMDYSDSNNITILGLVNELNRDPRTKEREEKRFLEKERKTDGQLKRISGIPGRNSQVSEQKERVQSNKDKAIADDGESSVDNLRSTPVHNPEIDDEQSSVNKDRKVQVVESQPAMDTKPRYVKLKGKSPSSKVIDKYPMKMPKMESECLERRMDLETCHSPHGYADEGHLSELSTKEPRGLIPTVREWDTISTILGMSDTCCVEGYAEKQMAKLDEESDLNHLDQPSEIGKAAIGAHLKTKEDNLCKSNQKMMSLMSAENHSNVKVCVGNGVACSQVTEITQDHNIPTPDHNVKENQVYIPPHRRSDQDWQEHVNKGFTGQPWNVNSKSHLQISFATGNTPGRREVNTHSTGLSETFTKSFEIQVDMGHVKPQSRDTSVQCELIGGPMGIDIPQSTDDFDGYFQFHQGLYQQESNLSDKHLDDSLVAKSVTSSMLEKQFDAGCDLEPPSWLEDSQPYVEPCSSSTLIKDTVELANNMDSSVHFSDGEINSFSESKELVNLHNPTSLSSQLVILDPDIFPEELFKDINSHFQRMDKETLSRLLDLKHINDKLLNDQHFATSLIYRIMVLLRYQGCKNPLKGLGLV